MGAADPTSTPERPEDRAINAALHALGVLGVAPYISGGRWLVELDEELLRAAADAAYRAGREDENEKTAADIEAEVAWQRTKYGDGSDKAATGRLVGMEDALRIVREHGKES